MADFCMDCSLDMFGEDFDDLAGLCPEGKVKVVICEGCEDPDAGNFFIYVDHTGVRVRKSDVTEDQLEVNWR